MYCRDNKGQHTQCNFCMQNVALCYMNICLVATPVQHVAENRNTFYFHATCHTNFKGCYGDGCEYT